MFAIAGSSLSSVVTDVYRRLDLIFVERFCLLAVKLGSEISSLICIGEEGRKKGRKEVEDSRCDARTHVQCL